MKTIYRTPAGTFHTSPLSGEDQPLGSIALATPEPRVAEGEGHPRFQDMIAIQATVFVTYSPRVHAGWSAAQPLDALLIDPETGEVTGA